MKILFQGDSITDSCRDREGTRSKTAEFGCGYALMVKGELGLESPGKYEFANRGISGNRIVDLYARMKCDILNLKPDVMSILIGVNDVWHDLSESPNGVSAEKYYKIYKMLIEEIKAELPNIKIMILEPFALPGFETQEKIETIRAEVAARAVMAKKVAEEFNLTFIPLQEGFDKFTEVAPADYWLFDGVHPTPMGYTYIKNQWIAAFKKMIAE